MLSVYWFPSSNTLIWLVLLCHTINIQTTPTLCTLTHPMASPPLPDWYTTAMTLFKSKWIHSLSESKEYFSNLAWHTFNWTECFGKLSIFLLFYVSWNRAAIRSMRVSIFEQVWQRQLYFDRNNIHFRRDDIISFRFWNRKCLCLHIL